MSYINYYQSPIGLLLLTSSDEGLTGLYFENGKYLPKDIASYKEKPSFLFDETRRWLDIYFSKKEPNFTPLLHFTGTAFRQKVCKYMCGIPYGATISYGDIARFLTPEKNIKRLSQAVGQAVAHNPISIIIPCHRVIGSNRNLTGYGGGLKRKIYLLALEKDSNTTGLLF
ncbi:MAG: methylated-DNA--[protein]-cysteine S-methyltransferase [Treponema sp.]